MGISDLHLGSGDLAQWDAVVAALEKADVGIPRDVTAALRRVAQAVAGTARRNVLGEPIHGVEQRGLRSAIADGTWVHDTFDGAEVLSSLDDWTGQSHSSLPLDMDEGGWMHPVWGHNPWVDQEGYFPWFDEAVDAHENEAERAVGDALDRNIADIESA